MDALLDDMSETGIRIVTTTAKEVAYNALFVIQCFKECYTFGGTGYVFLNPIRYDIHMKKTKSEIELK